MRNIILSLISILVLSTVSTAFQSFGSIFIHENGENSFQFASEFNLKSKEKNIPGHQDYLKRNRISHSNLSSNSSSTGSAQPASFNIRSLVRFAQEDYYESVLRHSIPASIQPLFLSERLLL